MRTEIQRLVHLHILVGHSVGVQSHQVSVNNMFGYCRCFFLNRVSLIPHLPTISILKSKNPCWPIPLILFFFFSECSLASPGSTCTNLGERDCKYEYIGDHCCCGQCSDSSWLSLACVPDSTTGEGVWQQQLCPVGGCDSQGEWLTFRQNTVRHNLKEFLPQEMSPRRTTLAAIQTTSTEQKS